MNKLIRNLDWNLLYTFMIIVQEKKLTSAAERLFITQPAVSLALKRLENTLGVKLLLRGNKFETTLAGEAVYKEACKVYAIVGRIHTELDQAPKAVSGTINIATISQVVSNELDEKLSEFFNEHLKVKLSIDVLTTAEIILAVELGRATMGICDGIIPDNLVKQLLRQEEYALYCGSEHPLFGKENLSFEDLRGYPFINSTADVFGGQHMGDVTALRAKASIGQSVRGQSSNVNELCRMIRIGLGIGFLPLHLVTEQESSELLWRLPPYDNLPTADIYLISNPETNFNTAERFFLNSVLVNNKLYPEN